MLWLLFGFKGRINRLQFFALTAVNGVALVIGSVFVVVMNARQMAAQDFSGLWLFAPLMVLSIWAWLASTYKRMADIGISPGLRRIIYVGVAVAGGVTNAAIGHEHPLLILAVRSTPILLMLFWPGRRDDRFDPSVFGPLKDEAAFEPLHDAPIEREPNLASAPIWPEAPLRLIPQPVVSAAPVFGRRGL